MSKRSSDTVLFWGASLKICYESMATINYWYQDLPLLPYGTEASRTLWYQTEEYVTTIN